MKLSEDAKRHADGLMSKSTYETALWIEEDQRRIRAQRTQFDPKFSLMTQHYEERIRRGFKAIINAYVEGYRMDEALIDDEDKDEIIDEVRRMINNTHHHVTNSAIASRDFAHPQTGEKIPNMDDFLAGRFERLLGEAVIELNLARNQLVLEQKQREKEEKRRSDYQINIQGHNYGGIQQGGTGNVQSNTSAITSGKLPPPKLTIPRTVAAEKIKTQLERGRHIRGLDIYSPDFFEKVRADKSRWRDYTTELLKRIFDNDSIANEFSSPIKSPAIEDPPFDYALKKLRHELDEYLSRLESISDRLDLIPGPKDHNQLATPAKESAKQVDEEAANKLYDQVVSMSQDWGDVDEAKAQLIIEYSKDAIELFGKTNQDKKVDLKRLADKAEQVIAPDSIDTFKKRAEKLFLRLIYPKNPKLRNAVLIITGVAIVLSFTIPLLQNIQLPETTPTPSNKQKIVVILSDVTTSLTPEQKERVASLTADIIEHLPNKTKYVVYPIQAEPVRVLPIIPKDEVDTSTEELQQIKLERLRETLDKGITNLYKRSRDYGSNKTCIINLLSLAKDQLNEMSRAQDVNPSSTEYELFILSDMEENCDDTPLGPITLEKNITGDILRSAREWSSPPPDLSNVRITVIYPLAATSTTVVSRRPKDSQLKDFWRNIFIRCGLRQEWFWDNYHITWISNGMLPSRLGK